MGFIERLMQEREVIRVDKAKEKRTAISHRNLIQQMEREQAEKLQQAQEKIRLAGVFLEESGVLNLLRETEGALQGKGYNHTVLQVYAESKEEVDYYPPLLNEGDVVVHLRWGTMRKVWSWQRDWPGFNTFMDNYYGVSISVSSNGRISIPSNDRKPIHKDSFSLQEWRTNRDPLENALWEAYKKPFYLNYSDGESRKRHRNHKRPSPPTSEGFGGVGM